MALNKIETELQIEAALNGSSLSSYKKKDKGVQVLQVVMIEIFLQAVGSFNLNNTMDTAQVIRVCEQVKKKYYYLKFEEIVLILRRAKDGEYGKVYQLSGDVMMGWFDAYDSQRMEHVHAKQQQQHDKNKKGGDFIAPLSDAELVQLYTAPVKESKLNLWKRKEGLRNADNVKQADKEFREYFAKYTAQREEAAHNEAN